MRALSEMPAGLTSPTPPPQAAQPVAVLARSRSLTLLVQGPVQRLVSWLLKLAPRKQRASLPRAPKTLPLRQGRAGVVPPPAEPCTEPGGADDTLARRMLLQLSEENARLRRELAARRGEASR